MLSNGGEGETGEGRGGKTKLKRIMQTLNNKLHSENRSYNISNSHKYNPDQINTELLTN